MPFVQLATMAAVVAAADFRLDHLMDQVTVLMVEVTDGGVRRVVDRPVLY